MDSFLLSIYLQRISREPVRPRKSSEPIKRRDIVGLKYFEMFRPLIYPLHEDHCKLAEVNNRDLHYDGTMIVASGGAVSECGEIQIWDTHRRTLIRSIKGSHDTFYGVSISPNNQQIAVGCADKLVRFFNMADGVEVMRCDNHLDWVFGSAFTNDGLRLAPVSRDKAAKLIDIASGHLIDDVNRSRDALICLTRHPIDDLIATGGTEGKVRLFKMQPCGGRLSEGDNKEESFVREFEHMASPIQAIVFSPDGINVACSALSGEVRIFKSENGQRVAQRGLLKERSA